MKTQTAPMIVSEEFFAFEPSTVVNVPALSLAFEEEDITASLEILEALAEASDIARILSILEVV